MYLYNQLTYFRVVLTGILCASFYHFFVHDKTGSIGIMLRRAIPSPLRFGLTDETFAAVVVSLFMQITGILQISLFFGPDFSPFSFVGSFFESPSWSGLLSKPQKPESKQKSATGKARPKSKVKHT